ncbi:MAG TPA: MnhB domain-containing protein [Egibacteraceae bacterium]|nr:MnhB domain-containing protein [Egibacteraceae bacterium]
MKSLILETGTRAVFHTILVFSVFLLFAGHNSPGGGFIGGLVAGAALVLRYVAYGAQDVHRLVPLAPEAILGVGVLLAAGTGVGGLLLGGDFLEAGYLFRRELPLLDTVALHSAVIFDIGVFCVVVGLVLGLVASLGAERYNPEGGSR